jgi:hypothetical protein
LPRYLYFHTWLESKGIVTNEIPNPSAPAIRLDWEFEVDDKGEGYLSAYIEPNGLYIRQIGDELFFWHVNKDGDDGKDAPSYSITTSASASKVFGTVIPSFLAVRKLTANSKMVGCTTGRSAGLAPLRILPA